MSRWFRFYDDALDDPKVQRLPPDLFKAWVNILCVASRGGGVMPCVDDMAFSLRVTRDITDGWIVALRERGLIDVSDDGSMSPHNWNARQFKSDADPTAAERQARKRARDAASREQNLTPEPSRNVTRDVTPSRDRTETETETEDRLPLRSSPSPETGSGDLFVVEKPKAKKNTAEADAIVDDFLVKYDLLATAVGLPKVRAITNTRRTHILARGRDLVSVFDFADAQSGFTELFNKVRGSPWLSGAQSGDRKWKADIDWLITESNFVKVIEGKYEKTINPNGRGYSPDARR